MIAENKYFKPATIKEAVKIAGKCKDKFNFVAGGTDLLVNKFQGNNLSSCLIDISDIKEMKEISGNDRYLKIGTATKLDDLKLNPIIIKEFPMIISAVNMVGSPVIRKNATIGGNILCENRCTFYNQSEWWREAAGYCLKCDGDVCIATGGKKNCFSKFVSDMAVVLISLDSSVEVFESSSGSIIPIEEIYSCNGIKPRNLNDSAIITAIHVPMKERYRSVFMKLRKRESVDFGSLTTSVTVNKSGRIRIVIGCMDPGPVIIEGNEKDNKEELIKRAFKKCRTIENDNYSRKYRKEMISVFLNRSFDDLQLFK